MKRTSLDRYLIFIAILGLVFSLLFFPFTVRGRPATYTPSLFGPEIKGRAPADFTNGLYLPVIYNQDPYVYLGVYTKGYIGHQTILDSEIHQLDQWASETGGKPLSILATFINLEETGLHSTLIQQLEYPWINGYTVFINMGSTHTALDIANGSLDAQLEYWAGMYNTWVSKGGGRWAILAPLQEMNGYWTPYGLDPVNFKLAYRRIQTIFEQAGVPKDSVRWAFAPNGYEEPGDPPFEAYYPGDEYVSIVSFSSYNFGYCSVGLDRRVPRWETAEQIFGSFISRMRSMAPGKPIFIAETATTSYTNINFPNEAAKNQWLISTYNYLAGEGVKGILYLNSDTECDWAFFQPNGRKLNGYRQVAAGQKFRYLEPAKMINVFP